jgi:hypothetical protein
MTTTSRILSLTTAAVAAGCITALAGVQSPATRTDSTYGAASSTSGEGPYVRVDAGVSFISGANVKLDLPLGEGLDGRVKFKPGFAFGGALGYRVEQVAFEVELDTTHNKFKSGPGDGPWTDSFRQTTLMGNVVWAPTYEGVTFWLGGGLGAQFQNTNFADSSTPYTAVTGGSLASSFSKSSDTAFVGQIKAGVSVPLDDRWSFDAGYKLRFVGESDLGQGSISFIPTLQPAQDYSAKLKLESHLSHLLSAGFTYRF